MDDPPPPGVDDVDAPVPGLEAEPAPQAEAVHGDAATYAVAAPPGYEAYYAYHQYPGYSASAAGMRHEPGNCDLVLSQSKL